jgi:phosphatidylserine/phosphatidylglycerophosphate/cardiolipin synthase-like enzyme
MDRKRVFVSSANFTEAAQVRNIEVGLLIDSPSLADGITKHFGSMLDRGLLRVLFT